MATNIKGFNYRLVYKALRAFYSFSFKLPHYKKDFTPQQKSAITRKYRKIFPYLNDQLKINSDEFTFLKYPKKSKLKNIDGIRLDSGLIYKWPQARLIKSPLEFNAYLIEINPKKRFSKKKLEWVQKFKDVFIPFPSSIISDINKIRAFVRYISDRFHPHDILWSIKDKRERIRYDPEIFDLYFSNEFLYGDDDDVLESVEYNDLDFIDRSWVWKRRKMRKKHEEMPDYYNGVFITRYLE